MGVMGTSFDEIREAAEQGNVDAQYSLGFIYYRGTLKPQDYSKASRWFQNAAAQMHAKAQNHLGFMYYHAQGIEKDVRKAMLWYQAAAEQGISAAQYMLGVIYDEAAQQVKEFKTRENAEHIRESAEQRSEEAQYLGLIYHLMESETLLRYFQAREQEYELAESKFYDKCRTMAEHGHPEAMYYLGLMYYEGDEEKRIPKDEDEGKRLLQAAAEQGCLKAQKELLSKRAESEAENDADSEMEGLVASDFEIDVESDAAIEAGYRAYMAEQEEKRRAKKIAQKLADKQTPATDEQLRSVYSPPDIRRLNEEDVDKFKQMSYPQLVGYIKPLSDDGVSYLRMVSELEHKGVKYIWLQLKDLDGKVEQSINKQQPGELCRWFWAVHRKRPRYKNYKHDSDGVSIDSVAEYVMCKAAAAFFDIVNEDDPHLYIITKGWAPFIKGYAKKYTEYSIEVKNSLALRLAP